MRHFHLTRNQGWRPIINVDKLWSLVPEEQKKGLTERSDIVPVIDTLRFGYGKVLGNGMWVLSTRLLSRLLTVFPSLPKLPCIVKARFVSAKAEYVSMFFTLWCPVVTSDVIGPKLRKLAVLYHWSLKIFSHYPPIIISCRSNRRVIPQYLSHFFLLFVNHPHQEVEKVFAQSHLNCFSFSLCCHKWRNFQCGRWQQVFEVDL